MQQNQTPKSEITPKNLTAEERAEVDKFIGPGCEMFLQMDYENAKIVCGWSKIGLHYRMVSNGSFKMYDEKLGMFKTEDVDIDQLIMVSRQAFTSVEIQKSKSLVKEHPEAEEETEIPMYIIKLLNISGMIIIPTPNLEFANMYKKFHWDWMHGKTPF